MPIVVPGASDAVAYLGFGRRLRELPFEDCYEFDFGGVELITPGWLLTVGSAFRLFRRQRPSAKRRGIRYKHLSYAAHMGFFRYFGIKFGKAPGEAFGSDTYVPITEFNVGDLRRSAAREYLHPGELVERQSRQLAEVLARKCDGPLVDILTYSLREIIRNVIEHSDSQSFTVAAQYWPQSGQAELAVADQGCGILESLKENPRLKVDTELEALRLAVLPGVSSKAWRRSGGDDAWTNSGYGLFMTQRLSSHGGCFTLLSGDHGLLIDPLGLRDIKTHGAGTSVVLRLQTAWLPDLTERLSAFREEGRAIASEVDGADRFGPSLASRFLQPAITRGDD